MWRGQREYCAWMVHEYGRVGWREEEEGHAGPGEDTKGLVSQSTSGGGQHTAACPGAAFVHAAAPPFICGLRFLWFLTQQWICSCVAL